MKFFKLLLFTFSCSLLTCITFAQTTATYISHTILSGETLTALAKQYHTTVGNIMRLNHMNTQSILTIGEVVKIPTTQTTAVKPVAAVAAKPATITIVDTTAQAINGTPIIHIVGKGESLYTLAKQFHTTIPALKSWNKMTGDVIIDGHKLIVGYKPFASTTPYSTTQSIPQPKVSPPAETQPQQASQPVQNNIIAQPPPQVQQPAVDNTPSIQPPITAAPPTVIAPATTAAVATQPSQNDIINMQNPEGYFASSFGLGTEGRSLQTANGTSMTFKTASGWNDKKYYILINDVPPGSIVRVMSANNKIIYAKVLWSMTAMKENTGLDYRISTAAAAALGLSEAKFPLTITFFE